MTEFVLGVLTVSTLGSGLPLLDGSFGKKFEFAAAELKLPFIWADTCELPITIIIIATELTKIDFLYIIFGLVLI